MSDIQVYCSVGYWIHNLQISFPTTTPGRDADLQEETHHIYIGKVCLNACVYFVDLGVATFHGIKFICSLGTLHFAVARLNRRMSVGPETFEKHLKTHLFRVVFFFDGARIFELV